MEKQDMTIFENDQPIISEEEDLLGRTQFAKQLADMLCNYANMQTERGDGIVIGIEGAWGSGKTSLFNLMESHLDTAQFKVQRFNSWLAINRFSLIELFFEALNEAMSDDKKMLKALRRFQQKFVRNAAQIAVNSGAVLGSFYGIPGTQVLKDSIQKMMMHSSVEQKHRQQKNFLKKDLQKHSKKWIVFFIDDIDRLSDEQIGLVFQLVKNIADFPRIIYVLAYDKNIVIRALNRVQQEQGKEYLQKVVQVPVAIPEPDLLQLRQILEARLNGMMKGRIEGSIDKQHLQDILQILVGNYIKNIRDCERVLNAFSFRYTACGESCDVGDLLAVTVLELYESPVVRHMVDHKEFWLAPDIMRGLENEISKEGEVLIRNLEECCSLQTKMYLKELLGILFPQVANVAGWPSIERPIEGSAVSQRINQEIYFDRYFRLVLPREAVSLERVVEILKGSESSQICNSLIQLIQSGRIDSFFRQAAGISIKGEMAEKFRNPEAGRTFMQAVTAAYRQCKNQIDPYRYQIWRNKFCFSLLEEGWQDCKTGEWDQMAVNILFENSQISMAILLRMLRTAGYGIPGFYGNETGLVQAPFMPEALFYQLAQTLRNRIVQTAQRPEVLLREESIADLLYFWRWHDKKTGNNSYSEFLKKSSCGVVLIWLVISMLGKIFGYEDGKTTWSWHFYFMEPQLQTPEIVGRVKQYLLSETLDIQQLHPDEVRRAAAYLALMRKILKKNTSAHDAEVTEAELDEMIDFLSVRNEKIQCLLRKRI